MVVLTKWLSTVKKKNGDEILGKLPETAFEDDAPEAGTKGVSHNFGEAEVNNPDFTQLASQGKQYANPLGDRYDRVEPTTQIPGPAARAMSRAYRSMQGINSIAGILIANSVQVDLGAERAINPAIAHDLLTAALMLSEYAIDDIESTADWAQGRSAEDTHHGN